MCRPASLYPHQFDVLLAGEVVWAMHNLLDKSIVGPTRQTKLHGACAWETKFGKTEVFKDPNAGPGWKTLFLLDLLYRVMLPASTCLARLALLARLAGAV